MKSVMFLKISIFLGIFFVCYVNVKCTSLRIDENLLRQSVFYGVTVTAVKEVSDSACRSDLSKIAESLYERKKWAVKLLDASGTPTTGLHWGSRFWLGNRYQCENTMVLKRVAISENVGPINKDSVEDIPPFPVAYYAAYFKHDSDILTITHEDNEFIITLGLCLPTSCDEIHLIALLQKYFDSNLFNHQYIYNTTYQMENVKKIDGDNSWLWNISTILTGSALLILILLCVIGTVYDIQYHRPLSKNTKYVYTNGNNNKNEENGNCINNNVDKVYNLTLRRKMIKCFSVYSNFKTFLNVNSYNDNIPCIHTLRFFSTLFVCLGHNFFFLREFFENLLKMYYNFGVFFSPFAYLTFFSTDTSFCIGGYILAYSFFKKEYNEPDEKFSFYENAKSFATSVTKRFFRLIPAYLLFIGIATVFGNWHANNSPFLLNFPDNVNCPNYWWRNVLYIHNLYPMEEFCMVWTWYFSSDMQYYILITFLLILSKKYFYTASTILLSILFGSILYTRQMVYSTGYFPTFDSMLFHSMTFYYNPVSRIASYIVGVFAAYFVYKRKNDFKLNKIISYLLWLLSFLLNAYFMIKMIDYDVDFEFSLLYMTFAKLIWASSTAWIIIACETGNAGFIGDVLSWKWFIPFTHISYIVQLLNPIVIYVIASSKEYASHISMLNLLSVSLGNVVIIYLIAVFVSILIELPNASLIKTVLNHGSPNRNDVKKQ